MTTSTFNRFAIVLGVAGIMVGLLIRTDNQAAIIPLALTLGVLALAGKAMGALPMYTDSQGQPVAGSSGKYGWCWQLEEPLWTWDGLTEIRPRTLRMEFA